MTGDKICQWVALFLMLIGWAVMFAAGVLPDLWAAATLALIAMMFGLPPIVGGIKSTVKKLTK